MAVYIVNLVIDQGADFTQTFNLEDDASASALDLTGYSGCLLYTSDAADE